MEGQCYEACSLEKEKQLFSCGTTSISELTDLEQKRSGREKHPFKRNPRSSELSLIFLNFWEGTVAGTG